MTATLDLEPAREGLTPRPYQEEAIQAVQDEAATGVNRQVVVLPTGAGKTIVFAELAKRRNEPTLILAHRDELIQQAVEKILRVWPSADIGIVKAERNEHYRDVVVASVQTLARKSRLSQLAARYKLIITDECHHSAAPSYRGIYDYLGCGEVDGPLHVGFTATPDRGDKKGLDDVFEKISYFKDIRWGITENVLCDIAAIEVKVDLNLDTVKTRHGDFADGALGDALMAADAPEHIVEAWKAHASDRAMTLAFSPTVAMAQEVSDEFNRAGITSDWISGAMDMDRRREVLRKFSAGELKVMSNCMIATEGYDEPAVDCILMARPTKSRPLFQQIVGRGLRRFPGKENCLLLDVIGVSRKHRLVTAASLLGVSEGDMKKGGGLRAIAADETRKEEAKARLAGRLVSDTVDLWKQFEQAKLAWVKSPRGIFACSTKDALVSLERTGEGWGVIISRQGQPRTILSTTKQGLPIEVAQGIAEDWMRQKGTSYLSDKNAAWRLKEATPKQIEALRKWGVNASTMTAGEASDRMTALLANKRR